MKSKSMGFLKNLLKISDIINPLTAARFEKNTYSYAYLCNKNILENEKRNQQNDQPNSYMHQPNSLV